MCYRQEVHDQHQLFGINLMLGGWESGLLTLRNQCVGYVCKQFVLRKNDFMKTIDHCIFSIVTELSDR